VRNKEKFTDDIINRCNEIYGDGIGIAWQSNNYVEFRKGIDVNELKNIIKNENIKEFVVHFRLATSGEKCKELCHPFPLDIRMLKENETEGKTNAVLFQNGTESLTNIKRYINKYVRDEKLSDTKALAYLLTIKKDIRLLHLFNSKFIVVTPFKIKMFEHFIEDNKNYYSNDVFREYKKEDYNYNYFGNFWKRKKRGYYYFDDYDSDSDYSAVM